MRRSVQFFNERRLRELMDRKNIDLIILRTVENSIYVSEFFNNGGELGYRPFTVFYFRDPGTAPAFVVPAVDLHLARESTWIEDVRAYAMAEFITDVGRDFYRDFFEAAAAILAERKVRNMVVGIEGENLTAGFRSRLEALLVGNSVVEINQDMDQVRMVRLPRRSGAFTTPARSPRKRTRASGLPSSLATPTPTCTRPRSFG